MPWRQRAYTTSDLCSANIQPDQPFAPPFITCAPQPVVPDISEPTSDAIKAAWDLARPQVEGPPPLAPPPPQHQASWLPMLDIGISTGNMPVTQQSATEDQTCYDAIISNSLDSFAAASIFPGESANLNTPLQVALPSNQSSLRKRTCTSHTRKRDPGHVKRPCNAFMLFRSHAVANQLVPKEVEKDHRNISRIISYMWRSLSSEERRMWDIAAENERERHRQLHPDYKYRPSSRRANVHRRINRRSSVTERQCENIADAILKACGREGIKKETEKETPSGQYQSRRCETVEANKSSMRYYEADNAYVPPSRKFLPRRSSSAPPTTPHMLEFICGPRENSDVQVPFSTVAVPPQVSNVLGPTFPSSPAVQASSASGGDGAKFPISQGFQFTTDPQGQFVSQLTPNAEQLLDQETDFSKVFDIERSMENFSLDTNYAETKAQIAQEPQEPLIFSSTSKSGEQECDTTKKCDDGVADLWAQLLSSIHESPQAPLEILKNESTTLQLSTTPSSSPGLSTALSWTCVQPWSPDPYTLLSPTMPVP